MTLTKYKLGELIKPVDERNSGRLRNFYGVNINKEFMPTVADTSTLDEKKYKVVRKNRFACNLMHVGRDIVIPLAFHRDDEPIIVSPAYVIFEVTATDKILPEYFFMIFQSKEKDRLGWFLSDSSVRGNIDWKTFCDIEINLPSLLVQKKFVAVYNALLENKKAYERGLEDLKLVCAGYIDRLKHTTKNFSLGELLEEIDDRNYNGEYKTAYGINITKNFMPSTASSDDLRRYKIVRQNQFAYSGMQTGRDECIRIALHRDDTPIIISPAYSVLKRKSDFVLEEYIQMWFLRAEIDRLGSFMSDSSIRANLDLQRFFEMEIPIPDMNIQHSIAAIYEVYRTRKDILERLKEQIKDICPILIKGSLDEGAAI